MQSSGLVSPLMKCATYIDMDDVNTRKWDVRGWPSKWKRFELNNRGIYNGAWANKELKRGQDDWYLCQIISCKIELPERLKGRLWQIFKDLDMRSFKKYERESSKSDSMRWNKWDVEHPIVRSSSEGSRKQYLVIFCLGALLHNQAKYDDLPKYYPAKECESRKRYAAGCRRASNFVDEEFHDRHELLHQFADDLGFRDEDIQSCMEKLRSEHPPLRERGG